MSKCYLSISLLFGISCMSAGFAIGSEDLSSVDSFTSFTEQSFNGPSSKAFAPFTGKIKSQKVRVRALADTDSAVIKELVKDELIVVVGEKGNFYAIEPPSGVKAYVFRTFVLNGAIEGSKVNVRLQPSLEAPIIAHLTHGDAVDEKLCTSNPKWYEITPPKGTRFYIAKDYVQSVGGPEIKAQLEKKKSAAEKLFEASESFSLSEIKKPFKEINIDRIKQNYQSLIQDFPEFSQLCKKAKESLAALQETYTEKKIAFLEHQTEALPVAATAHIEAPVIINATDRMKMWQPVEESLFLTWSSYNDEKTIEDFYDEQRQNAVVLTGIVEPFSSPVKKKPGDFILKDNDLPKAYLYSTHVNLQDFVGKKVAVYACPRANNHFAFPAYFVISVE